MTFRSLARAIGIDGVLLPQSARSILPRVACSCPHEGDAQIALRNAQSTWAQRNSSWLPGETWFVGHLVTLQLTSCGRSVTVSTTGCTRELRPIQAVTRTVATTPAMA